MMSITTSPLAHVGAGDDDNDEKEMFMVAKVISASIK